MIGKYFQNLHIMTKFKFILKFIKPVDLLCIYHRVLFTFCISLFVFFSIPHLVLDSETRTVGERTR